MKFGAVTVVILALAAFAPANAANFQASPIEKIIEMISDLQAKVIGEGKDAQKAYDEYAEWCEDRARSLDFEVKTGNADVADLKSTIDEETSKSEMLETKIEDLSNDIKTDQANLDEATKIREKEAADFAAEEKELTTTISMMERATSILSREMKKGGAAMLQLKTATSITDALTVMVGASVLSSSDASALTALVQTNDHDELDTVGAPAAAVYEGQSGGIIGALEGLTEKAEAQLDKARKAESTSLQNYQMVKQSLTDEVEFANKDMAKAKKNLAESQEKNANAAGDLDVTSKDLAEDIATKSTLHQDCMAAAEEFETATKSRGEELKALATAKKVIQDATGGAASQTYLQVWPSRPVSLLQMERRARIASSADLAKSEAVRFIRDLARKSKSTVLAQLASRMSSAMRLGSAAGEDPFAKVKGLITDMIATLESEAEEDASQKAYCDKEMSATTAKSDDLTLESNKLSTKIDQDKAASANLKGQVANLQKELAGMATAKAEADKMRAEENAAFKKNSAEMDVGIEGVKKALQVLREYYAKDAAHDAASGAGEGIIGLLEVCESDFTKGLAEMTAEEQTAAADYTAYVKEDEISTVKKQQDAKYKTKEAAGLDKNVAELSSDLASVSDELSAVTSALDKLKEMCVAKAEPYAERKARREAEISGLKEALQILEGEAALLQTAAKHTLRGARPHHVAA